MKTKFVQLYHIVYRNGVKAQDHSPFLYNLQKGVILSLKQQGHIDHLQCTAALEQLEHQAGQELCP